MKFILSKIIFFLPLFSTQAIAHAFDEKYDLPLPIDYFLWGAGATVALTYVFAIVFLKSPKQIVTSQKDAYSRNFRLTGPIFSKFLILLQVCFLMMVGGLLTVGLTGPQNPLMNLLPHVLWVNWWIGMPLLFLLFGNVLQGLSPIDMAFDSISLFFSQPIKPLLSYPNWLGCWPATCLLLGWCWIEVIYPNAALPHYISTFVIFWFVACIGLKILFGKNCFREQVDFFAIYFSYFGMMSPLQYSEKQAQRMTIVLPFKSLLSYDHSSISGSVGFIIAMLATVLFDGLHGSGAWQYYDQFLSKHLPKIIDINGYVPGALGIFLVWFLLYGIFLLSCSVNLILCRYLYPQLKIDFQSIVRNFAPTLVPIAMAYLIAHNFSSLILQGQNFLALLSDPYQLGWDICGTANFRPDITLIDAKVTWYIALISIVIGHVISIWLCHLSALKLFKSPTIAGAATFPLSLVMIFYTVISLIILAEPLTNG